MIGSLHWSEWLLVGMATAPAVFMICTIVIAGRQMGFWKLSGDPMGLEMIFSLLLCITVASLTYAFCVQNRQVKTIANYLQINVTGK